MSRLLVILVALIVIVVGGLFALAGMNTEKPPVRIEKTVPSDKLAK